MSLVIPVAAAEAQLASSDPAASVWVAANAGAGKTYVLAQRVVRLVLSGVPPRAILCLTYTNAAAAEMAQRVYDALARLATLPEAELRADVARLAPDLPAAVAVERARTLFAEALETPGGLKVQTIHAFAAALLRRFPLEANVSGSFAIIDEAERDELADRAIAEVLARAVVPGPEAELVAALVPHVSDVGLSGAIKAALAQRRTLAAWLGFGQSAPRLARELEAALDLPAVPAQTIDEATCRAIVAASGGGKFAERIAATLAAGDDRAKRWADVFLTKEAKPRSNAVPKNLAAAFPDLEAAVAAEQARLAILAERERGEASIAATVPLMQLSFAVLERIEAEKRRRALIDYDDQIETARNLVRTGTAAAWVRYKLDEGIDHVMVDEAQDTSPTQWALVRALTEEFFAGLSARETNRTLFVVGDEKQSIYSFQGADPRLFASMRTEYAAAAEAAQKVFRAVGLTHSMRSSQAVLTVVDRVFADELAASVGATPGAVRHDAVREAPGGVDLWPLLKDDETAPSDAWDAPLDRVAASAGVVKLTRAIADQVAAWTREAGPDGGAPVRPGDVMILARRREPFASLMNRELRARGIATAGADRLDVTAHIAVKDMIALARALISRDDLSLAAVLKSPLFDFSEEELFGVAHGRAGSLFHALAEGDAKARDAHARLAGWRRTARSARPFDLFARILVAEGRRADFAARLGSEAEDALDAFLDAALGFEGTGIPTLETFLDRTARMRTELRRTADARADAVRVMTAHGAKGLEATVVFLADVGTQPIGGPQRPSVFALARAEPDDGAPSLLVYAPNKDYRGAAVTGAQKAAEASERDEHNRLLYVGLTRAERWLVVCGAFGKREPGAGMWHGRVEAALAPIATRVATPGGEGLRLRDPATTPPPRAQVAPAAARAGPPAWLLRPARMLRRGPEPMTASADEHVAAEGVAEPVHRALDAATYGTVLHLLLQVGGDVPAMTARVRAAYPALSARDVAALVAEAQTTAALPELAAASVRREIDLVGDILHDGAVRRVSARIDRLQLDGDRALVVDYKTDRVVPRGPAKVPDGYRRQLAIYRALLQAVLPRHAVSAAIVWTAKPLFMRLDGALPAVALAPAGSA